MKLHPRPQGRLHLYLFLLLSVLILHSECKVKKLKAVKKLLKAKVLLKPLIKSGMFKFPMVHFVIPMNLKNNQQQQQNQGQQGPPLGFLTPSGPGLMLPDLGNLFKKNNNKPPNCVPNNNYQPVQGTIPIGSRPCPPGSYASSSSGGTLGSLDFGNFMNDIAGSMPRFNLGGLSGLFGGFGGNPNCVQRPTDNCRPYYPSYPAPSRPYPERPYPEQRPNWVPMNPPPQYNPPQYKPPQYNPPQYNPPQYNPPQYNPPQYRPQYNQQYNHQNFPRSRAPPNFQTVNQIEQSSIEMDDFGPESQIGPSWSADQSGMVTPGSAHARQNAHIQQQQEEQSFDDEPEEQQQQELEAIRAQPQPQPQPAPQPEPQPEYAQRMEYPRKTGSSRPWTPTTSHPPPPSKQPPQFNPKPSQNPYK